MARQSNKILITGSAGFVGSNLFDVLNAENETIGIDIVKSKTTTILCDVKNNEILLEILTKYQPNIIIHSAAIKSLTKCENKKMLSWRNNVGSTQTIVNYCLKNDTKFIFISSDVIFDGVNGNYRESDQPDPVNWYGTTKFFGELLTRQLNKFVICRTAFVLGNLHYPNIPELTNEIQNPILNNQSLFPHYVFNRLKHGNKVYLPSNIISSPTHIKLLTHSIVQIIVGDFCGTFHIAGSEAISRFLLAKKIAWFKNLNEELIIEDNTNSRAIRPKNISLNVDHTYNVLGLNKNEWGVDSLIKDINLFTL